MAAVEEIHVGDIGTRLEGVVEDSGVAVDLTTATSVTMRLEKPDRSRVDHPATIDVPLLGEVHYTTVTGDTDQAGHWLQQLIVIFPTGTFKSDVESFTVHENIAAP